MLENQQHAGKVTCTFGLCQEHFLKLYSSIRIWGSAPTLLVMGSIQLLQRSEAGRLRRTSPTGAHPSETHDGRAASRAVQRGTDADSRRVPAGFGGRGQGVVAGAVSYFEPSITWRATPALAFVKPEFGIL